MPFDNGSLSFTICKMMQTLPDDALDRFENQKGYSLATVLDEPQIGWVSGRHLLDTQIDESTALPGGHLHLVLRSAVRKIPPALFKAECRIEELAAAQKGNIQFLSRKQKKEIKEDVKDRLLKDMPPALRGIPFVVDAPAAFMYLAATSLSQIDQFLYFFCETIGFEPLPLTAELLAETEFKANPDNLPRLLFTDEPVDIDYESSIGRDFMTWLWFFQEERGGTFKVADLGEFSILVQGPLVLAGEGDAAQEIVVRRGLPTISGEANSALLSGKKLKKAKFLLARDDEMWSFTLDADTLVFRSVVLPPVTGLDPGSHFQERIKYLTIFRKAFFRLFELWLSEISDPAKMRKLSGEVVAWAKTVGTHK